MNKLSTPKLALAVIIKNTKEEVELLNRCLDSLKGSYDGLFVTYTSKEEEDFIGGLKYKANLSHFKWVNDFSKARNFNFSQVPEDYDFIMWTDSDDIWLNSEAIRGILEQGYDAVGTWYAYDHDEWGNCTVAHKKTMIIRNGDAHWVGALHEELIPNRDLRIGLATELKRVHQPTKNHQQEASERNELISKEEYERNKEDPRMGWNYGNSLISVGKAKEAIEVFNEFIEETGSTEEEYLAYLRKAEAHLSINQVKEAKRSLQMAIGLKPAYPDAYLRMGQIMFDENSLDDAVEYTGRALTLKPPTDSIIVFNPRDYDYNPIMLLAKTYYKKGKYDTCLALLKEVQKIVPESKDIKNYIDEIQNELDNLQRVDDLIDEIMSIEDIEKRKKAILKLPKDLYSHPKVCVLRNKHFVKTESSGKDVVFYCGLTTHIWNPIMFKTKGVGGSEESVIHLSKRFAKQGYNVEVYANVGNDEIIEDGVHWKPFWMFNKADKVDHLILWRSPKLVDYDPNATNIYVELHDVVKEGEFTKKRLEKIKKIFVKSHYHRQLFPNLKDELFAVIPNGFELDSPDVKRDPYLLINTSSPDRSLNTLPDLFKRVKEKVPQAKMKWAYGWEIFDNSYENNPKKMAWRNETEASMNEAGIENLGRLSQKEVSKLYKEARIFAYPSVFPEICCISLTKAQAGGAIPVTTDFGVFKEKNKFGKMVPVETTYGYQNNLEYFGLEDKEAQDKWVDEVVKILQAPMIENDEMKQWAHDNYNWDYIAKQYAKEFKD